MGSSVSSDHEHLGALRSVYPFNWPSFLISAGGMLAIGTAFAYVGVLAALDAFEVWLLCYFFLPAGFLGYGVYLVVDAIPALGTSVSLYENGFVWGRGSERHVIRWDEIEAVWADILINTQIIIPLLLRYHLLIRCVDGREVTIHRPLSRIERLGDNIVAEVVDRLLPDLLKRIEKGETVTFGGFQINNMELITEGKRYPWERVGEVVIWNGSVTAFIKGDIAHALKSGFKGSPMRKVPNVFVMLALANNLAKAHSASS